VAGTGSAYYSGDGGLATSAHLSQPEGITFDSSGNLFIADAANNWIRKVAIDGTLSNVAGSAPCLP